MQCGLGYPTYGSLSHGCHLLHVPVPRDSAPYRRLQGDAGPGDFSRTSAAAVGPQRRCAQTWVPRSPPGTPGGEAPRLPAVPGAGGRWPAPALCMKPCHASPRSCWEEAGALHKDAMPTRQQHGWSCQQTTGSQFPPGRCPVPGGPRSQSLSHRPRQESCSSQPRIREDGQGTSAGSRQTMEP